MLLTGIVLWKIRTWERFSSSSTPHNSVSDSAQHVNAWSYCGPYFALSTARNRSHSKTSRTRSSSSSHWRCLARASCAGSGMVLGAWRSVCPRPLPWMCPLRSTRTPCWRYEESRVIPRHVRGSWEMQCRPQLIAGRRVALGAPLTGRWRSCPLDPSLNHAIVVLRSVRSGSSGSMSRRAVMHMMNHSSRIFSYVVDTSRARDYISFLYVCDCCTSARDAQRLSRCSVHLPMCTRTVSSLVLLAYPISSRFRLQQ